MFLAAVGGSVQTLRVGASQWHALHKAARPSISRAAIVAAFIGALPPSPADSFVVADGETHVIDQLNSFPFDAVEVHDSAGGMPTTVIVVEGGFIGSQDLAAALVVKDRSIAEVAGGTVYGTVRGQDESTITLSSGEAGGISAGSYVDDSASVTVSGGRVAFEATSSPRVHARGQSTLRVEGTAELHGMIRVSDDAVLEISGGSIIPRFVTFDKIEVNDDATVRIFGGRIGIPIRALENSVVMIYGLGFNTAMGEVQESAGLISGVLDDGSVINAEFQRATGARIVLVPEPRADSLAAFALVMIGGAKAIRRRLVQAGKRTRERDSSHTATGDR